jgi:hypothetical protein
MGLPLSSSSRARLYTLVHTLHETTDTNGTRFGMLTFDRSTARHFLAQAQPRTRDSQAECRGFESLCPLCLPPMSLDDTGGISLTNPADSASSSDAGGDGQIVAHIPTMTGNDLGGRSLVQAQVQAVVQGVATLTAAPFGCPSREGCSTVVMWSSLSSQSLPPLWPPLRC